MAISQNSEIFASDIRKELRRNYLRSALSTTTVNGVTCTNNNDGTYTVSGKATSDVWLTLGSLYLSRGTYRLVGNKANSGTHLKLHNSSGSSQCADLGSGANIEVSGDNYELSVYVSSGTSVVNSTLIKPMVTNDLEATYDDYISFDDSIAPNTLLAGLDVTRRIASGVPISPSTGYTATEDCYVVYRFTSSKYNTLLINNSLVLHIYNGGSSTETSITGVLPLKKGQRVTTGYDIESGRLAYVDVIGLLK